MFLSSSLAAAALTDDTEFYYNALCMWDGSANAGCDDSVTWCFSSWSLDLMKT